MTDDREALGVYSFQWPGMVKCSPGAMTSPFKPPMHPNPITQRRFRRGVRLEIYLPLIAGSLVLAGAVAGIVLAVRGGGISVWADVSLILVILPGLAIGLILAAVAGGLAYGVGWLIGKAPPYFNLAQDFMERLAKGVRRGSDVAVAPVLGANATLAALKSLFRRETR